MTDLITVPRVVAQTVFDVATHPGWTDEDGNAPDYFDARLAEKLRRRAMGGET